jgi:hypothetical protein
MSDFGKEVAKEHRESLDAFNKKPIRQNISGPVPADGVDKSVAEQVRADLEGLIKKHEDAP